MRVAQRAVLSESSIWHTHYQAELERLETGLLDLSLAEEVEWIVCQSARRTASQRDEREVREVVKRVAHMHDQLADWMESEGVTRSALSVARALCAWGLPWKMIDPTGRERIWLGGCMSGWVGRQKNAGRLGGGLKCCAWAVQRLLARELGMRICWPRAAWPY